MTSPVARLYAVVAGVLAFFLSWAAVVAHPWAPTAARAADPRATALAARQQQVHLESLRVQKIVQARWSAYRSALAKRNTTARQLASTPAAAPSVRVVTLPPLTVTRVS